jgi:hypothetical protein
MVIGVILGLFVLGPSLEPPGGHLRPHRGGPPMVTVHGAPVNAAGLLRRIARLFYGELGLPLPVQLTAHVYDNADRFELGLIADAAVPPARAAELARFAIGAAIPGGVLLRAPGPAMPQPLEWPRLIAHELAHVAQIELSGTETGPAQWLSEGMAEWVACRVLARLGLDEFERWRPLARAAAAEYVHRTGGLDLDALASQDGFVSVHRRAGTLTTYRLALHLADTLVTEHGFTALRSYFATFRVSDDAAANFAACFGTSLDAFEQRTLTRLRQRQAAASARSTAVAALSGAAGVST